jgi:hypothetical protein
MEYGLNGGQRYRELGSQERTPDPTPETIQLELSAIRLKWSSHETRIRDQISRWRAQAPHCPQELQQLLDER